MSVISGKDREVLRELAKKQLELTVLECIFENPPLWMR